MWLVSWEDDLVMTNVRSFDVKAYDNAFGGYADLGWGGRPSAVDAVPERGRIPEPRERPAGTSSTPSLTIWPPVATIWQRVC